MNIRKAILLTAFSMTLALAAADFNVGSGSYAWNNISSRGNSFSINGGDISFTVSTRVSNPKSFEIGTNGATFNMDIYVTFDGINFSTSTAGAGGGIRFNAGAGATHYIENSTLDVGTIYFAGSSTSMLIYQSRIVLSAGDIIKNEIGGGTFRMNSGTLALDLDSYARQFAQDGTREWDVVSSVTDLGWTNMGVGTITESFTKESDTLYSYVDSHGKWTFEVGSNKAVLIFSEIPEPSAYAALFGAASAVFAMRLRRKPD